MRVQAGGELWYARNAAKANRMPPHPPRPPPVPPPSTPVSNEINATKFSGAKRANQTVSSERGRDQTDGEPLIGRRAQWRR